MRNFINNHLWFIVVIAGLTLNEILAPKFPDLVLQRTIGLIVLFLLASVYLLISKKKVAFSFFTLLVGIFLFGGAETKIDTIVGIILFLVGLVSVFMVGGAPAGGHGVAVPKRKKSLGRSILGLLFLPFFLLNDILKPRAFFRRLKDGGIRGLVSRKSFTLKNIFSKLFALIIAFLILATLVPMWIAGYAAVLYGPAMVFGIVPFPIATPITGRSMEPTFKDQSAERFYIYNDFISLFKKPKRGDLITFLTGTTVDENKNVIPFVKRVVAFQGDEVELRDGLFRINGQIIEEPYIKKPRSTFGATFLQECQKTTVPDGFVFVLGDNRANSNDSRFLGFVSIKDITGIIPYSRQNKLEAEWRDASHDKERAGLMSFDRTAYYELFNKKREENGLNALKSNTKLENAAIRRAQWIIDNNELKVSPNDSKYTPQKAQGEAGYSNIVLGEMFVSGYFDSEDLSNYWMEHDTKKHILNEDYDDTGIGAFVGKINGCEVQVIVQEFGGYIPPNYSNDLISNWETSLNQLKSVLPSWENIKNYPTTYNSNKQDADRLLGVMRLRIYRMEIIVSKMKAQKWLTTEENNWTYEDEKLYKEQEEIAKKLNSQTWR